MPNLLDESLISLSQVPDLPMFSTRHKRLHYVTVYSWTKEGIKNGVRLESVKLGGSIYTTKEAVMRFISALNPPPELEEERVQLSPEAMKDDDQ